MSESPLKSLTEYSRFVSQILSHSDVERSTIVVWSNSLYTGTAEGEVLFKLGIRLRIREELDFDAEMIASYGYEVYRGDEKLYWYDDFPHPKDPSLASTFPHHKHVPPEMKRNRIPAANISFMHPNLPILIKEIEELIAKL